MAARDFLPKEHGAWAMLAQASFLAVLLGPKVDLNHALLVATATGVFVSRAPVAALRRRTSDRARVIAWAALLLTGAAAGAVTLATTLPAPLIVAVVAIAALVALFNVRHAERSTPAEVTAMLGFSLLIPVGVALAGGDWVRHGVSVGAVTFLFFASSIPHVRAMVQIRKDARSAAASRERVLSAVGAACVVGTAVAACVTGVVSFVTIVAASIVALRPVLSTVVVRSAKPPGACRGKRSAARDDPLAAAGVLEKTCLSVLRVRLRWPFLRPPASLRSRHARNEQFPDRLLAIRSVGLIELALGAAYCTLILIGERR